MSSEDLFVLILGAGVGGFVNGFAGFGTALFALGFFLRILPPTEAVAITLVLSVVTGVQGVWVVREKVRNHLPRLLRFLLPGILGIPLGTLILSIIDDRVLQFMVAVGLLAYGVIFALRRNLPTFERRTPFADMVVGFSGGILGGAASLSGALPTIWCAMRPWPRQEIRAVLQPFNVVILALAAGAMAIQGHYSLDLLRQTAIALVAALAAAQLGIRAFRAIDDTTFRRVIVWLMFLSGTVLMWRVLTGA